MVIVNCLCLLYFDDQSTTYISINCLYAYVSKYTFYYGNASIITEYVCVRQQLLM